MSDLTNTEYIGLAADEIRSQLHCDSLDTDSIRELQVQLAICLIAESLGRLVDMVEDER